MLGNYTRFYRSILDPIPAPICDKTASEALPQTKENATIDGKVSNYCCF